MKKYEYQAEIESTARIIIKEVLEDYSEEVVERDDIEDKILDRLHGEVDRHKYIINTDYHFYVMRHSRNEDSLEFKFGAEVVAEILKKEGFDTLIMRRAFWAMYNDVQDEISDIIDDKIEEHNEALDNMTREDEG